jgi:hypothetical protein
MKFTFPLATLLSLACTALIPAMLPVNAADFTETEIDQQIVIAVAKPYGTDKFDLLILEQIPGKQQCWSESGTNPAVVNPLLLNFDFTGKCRRATDANGYSIRIDGLDYGLEYLLRLVPRGNELLLIATSRVDAKKPEIVVGSTHGMVRGFMKIDLNPGWKFTKRTFGNKILGHFYFSTTAATVNSPVPVKTSPEVPTVPVPGSGDGTAIPTSPQIETPTPPTVVAPEMPKTEPLPKGSELMTPTPAPEPAAAPEPIAVPTPTSMPEKPAP